MRPCTLYTKWSILFLGKVTVQTVLMLPSWFHITTQLCWLLKIKNLNYFESCLGLFTEMLQWMVPFSFYGVPYITSYYIIWLHTFSWYICMICVFCVLSNRIKIPNKDRLALIFKLLTCVCKYSQGRPVLALPSTVADIFAYLHNSLLMHSNETYHKINF